MFVEPAQLPSLLIIRTKYTYSQASQRLSELWGSFNGNMFQVNRFLLEVQKASSLFCLVQNVPGVPWVACIGLKEWYKWSLGCARAFLEAFLELL